ncbi:putative membrane protein [Bacteroides fragilis str. S23L17]|nr:putative membrane protein [Bacteroides fragilis str. S23L17]
MLSLYKYQGKSRTIIMSFAFFLETIYCLLLVKYEFYE